MRQDEVMTEIASMLGIEEATTSTKGWFGKRLTAVKSIIDRMTEGEQRQLDAEVARINMEGYPDEVKRK
jgi:hypothetical protein